MKIPVSFSFLISTITSWLKLQYSRITLQILLRKKKNTKLFIIYCRLAVIYTQSLTAKYTKSIFDICKTRILAIYCCRTKRDLINVSIKTQKPILYGQYFDYNTCYIIYYYMNVPTRLLIGACIGRGAIIHFTRASNEHNITRINVDTKCITIFMIIMSILIIIINRWHNIAKTKEKKNRNCNYIQKRAFSVE